MLVKFGPILMILVYCSNGYGSTDSIVLFDILTSSQQAVRATLDLVEKESQMLNKFEQAQTVVEEKYHKALEAKYLFESTYELSKNLNDIHDVSDYTNKISNIDDQKHSLVEYYKRLRQTNINKSDKIVNKIVDNSIGLVKKRNDLLHKNYSGSSGNKKANIDSARATAALLEQGNNTNILLSQIYNIGRTDAELKRLGEVQNKNKTEELLRKWGILSKKGQGPFLSSSRE